MPSQEWNNFSKQDKAILLKSAGLPIGLSQLSWSGLQKSERAKLEKAMKGKGKGWHEQQEEVRTEKGIEKKAPIHRQVALEKEASEANNTPMQKPAHAEKPAPTPTEPIEVKETEEPKTGVPEPTGYFTLKKAQSLIRENNSKLSDEKLHEKSIRLRDYMGFIENPDEYSRKTLVKGGYYTGVIDQYVTGVVPVDPWLHQNLRTTLDEVYKEQNQRKLAKVASAQEVPLTEKKPTHEEKPTEPAQEKTTVIGTAIYDHLITKLREARTLKEVGDINQEATKAEISKKITFEQLQQIYSLVHEKDESLSRMNELLVDTYKMKIDRAEAQDILMALVREIDKSPLSSGYKTQLETPIKKKLHQLIEASDKKNSDLTLLNDFKSKIEQATDINQLAELSFQVTDNVANGNFTRAKVVTSDIHNLHELIDDKMSRLYKERIGTTEEFSQKAPMNLIVISTEVNRLRDLNKKVQASSLNQSKKDTLDVLINSKIDGIRRLSPKPNVESLDALTNIKESDAYKMLLIKISEFTTLTQLNTFSAEFNRQMKLMGVESVEDPRVSDIIKLMSAKRKQLAGTEEAKIIRTPEKYEIDNLKYEAEHVPTKMLPPKEIEDVTKYSWGLNETEAIKRYVDRERKKLQSNIDFTNKQKAELDVMAKEKPWVLLTRAEIQKRYPPEEAEQKIRDLWTYKTKKSDYEKNADSARFWQSKVDKIDSGEWQKINTNYLREQYQKEVKEAIKHGKPVPFDVIKQYPEFTKAQDNRERYDKGRHTSFANVSIAVDTKHQENTGVKIKRQDGKALDEKTADDVIKAISQFQSVVGDITPIMKREDLTIAHTGKKHPFLSTAAGIYHGTDVTISLGKGTGAHELLHFIDETAKRRHKDQPLYDYNLIAFAKKNMNGGVYAIERALSLNKYKSPEELEEARNLRYMLGSYWQRVEEVMARLIEQYTAYKDKGIQGTELLHHPYELYIRTPAYWDDVTFTGMLPQIEAELQRKIKLARE